MNEYGICGGTEVTPLFTARDENFQTTEEIFTVERCSSCGVAQTSPRPADSELGKYYPPVYYPIGTYDEARYQRTVGRYQRDKLALLAPEKRGGRPSALSSRAAQSQLFLASQKGTIHAYRSD